MPESRMVVLAMALGLLSASTTHAANRTQAAPGVSYALDIIGDLYAIDRSTGAASHVAAVPEGGAGLAIDSKGSIFTISGDHLRRIDPAEGSSTVIGPVGIGGYAMTFDLSDALYAGFNTPDALVRIDPVSASVTHVGVPEFGLHESFAGLAVDPTTGTMYAMASRLPTLTGVLYRIDPSDASVTRIGETTAKVCVMDIHFDASGTLYGASAALETLYTIDKETGAETAVGPTDIVAYGTASYFER